MNGIMSVVPAQMRQTSWNSKMQSHEYSGPCPFCGGNDRFHVYPDVDEIAGVGAIGRYLCMGSNSGGRSGCGRKGDGIDLAKELYNIGFSEACQKLGLDAQKVLDFRAAQKGGAAAPMKQHIETKALSEISDVWRTRAAAAARWASGQLTDEPLDYLLARGVTSQSIKHHLLGFNPEYQRVDSRRWGFTDVFNMSVPRGLLIPWFNDEGAIIGIRFRRLPSDESAEARNHYGRDKDGGINRYKWLRGSATQTLFNGETLFPSCDVALFEGELDAIIAAQSCMQSPISIAATGGTSGARSQQARRTLARCSQVLLCFDADEAGDKAADYWLGTLNNARRWRPLWSDANEMHSDGIDIEDWLSLALAPTPADDLRCACGAEVEYFGEDGIPYCVAHYSETPREVPPVAPAPDVIPTVKYNPDVCSQCGSRSVKWFLTGGAPYCDRCYQKVRPQGVWSR